MWGGRRRNVWTEIEMCKWGGTKQSGDGERPSYEAELMTKKLKRITLTAANK